MRTPSKGTGVHSCTTQLWPPLHPAVPLSPLVSARPSVCHLATVPLKAVMLLARAQDRLHPAESQGVNCTKKTIIVEQEIIKGEKGDTEDSALKQIIEQEFKFKREIWRLQKILRRGMGSEDPLPMFNRRHLLILVKRLCKDIDKSTYMLSKCSDTGKAWTALEKSMPLSHSMLCIAYADTIHEMREFLKREMARRDDSSVCYCTEIHAERSLLPLHRLKYISSINSLSVQHKNVVSSALDGCFTAISSMHSQSYVSEIDSLLDFALNMDPPPGPYYSAVKTEPIYQELIPELRRFDSRDDHLYEEITPAPRKPKRSSFFSSNCIKNNKDVSAREEFIPLTRMEGKVREIYA